ncbi:hypothetical protein Bpfe_008915 [Biomphalaria pfeifferi]|uniref:Uncharacterized protein n=1 Tax=Biomphalaria pfeifferi TaxID=112525 RepID=A0AAD8FF36_BIOPF|nr:hypothetical protein Bpfe_008915 [Biomphalaria pfeifferi]
MQQIVTQMKYKTKASGLAFRSKLKWRLWTGTQEEESLGDRNKQINRTRGKDGWRSGMAQNRVNSFSP